MVTAAMKLKDACSLEKNYDNPESEKVKVKFLSCVQLLATRWTAAHQVPLSMGFSRQKYWSGVPLPSPIALTRRTFFGKVTSLLFNTMSRLVIAFFQGASIF